MCIYHSVAKLINIQKSNFVFALSSQSVRGFSYQESAKPYVHTSENHALGMKFANLLELEKFAGKNENIFFFIQI